MNHIKTCHIKEVELQIQREISGKDYESHVVRPFFSVDNTQGSSDERVVALQKQIMEVLKKEPYMGEEVPIRQVFLVNKNPYSLLVVED